MEILPLEPLERHRIVTTMVTYNFLVMAKVMYRIVPMIMVCDVVSSCRAFHLVRSQYIMHQQSTRVALLSTTPRFPGKSCHHHFQHHVLSALSDAFLENDLVSVKVPSRLLDKGSNNSYSKEEESDMNHGYLFCVVRQDATVVPLCLHEDDVETDLFIDPRKLGDRYWQVVTDDAIGKTYGEGWYGQRPVPS
jgi:hypothetical protein